jgi:L-seryl-tRNA(Ser) seleniumtransferase
VLVPAHLLDGFDGVDQLTALVAAVHARDVPVVVDAAYMSYPVELLPLYAASGADLTCFSAKYFGGPNPGGFVSGSAKLITAVEGLDFTRFESGQFRIFGRPFKMSRYDVAATALALNDWLAIDQSARWKSYAQKVDKIAAALPKLEGVIAKPRLFTMDEALLDGPAINCLVLEFSPEFAKTAGEVSLDLESSDPIIVGIVQDGMLILAVDALVDGAEELVGARLSAALTSH